MQRKHILCAVVAVLLCLSCFVMSGCEKKQGEPEGITASLPPVVDVAEPTTAPVITPAPSDQPDVTDNPAVQISEGTIAFIAGDAINARKEPHADAEVLGTLSRNLKIALKGDAGNGWYKFTYNGNEAYVASQYVNVLGEAASFSPKEGVIKSDGINMRSSASSDSISIGTLAENTKVSVLKTTDSSWALVEYGGKIFYVASQYIDMD